jgi:hypothetical protein
MTRDQTRREGTAAEEETKSTENCQAASCPPQAARCRLKNSCQSLLKSRRVELGKPEAGSFQLVAGSLAVLSCSFLAVLSCSFWQFSVAVHLTHLTCALTCTALGVGDMTFDMTR